MIKKTALCLLMLTSPLLGALSPLAQSIKEISAILHSPELSKHLPTEAITEISSSEEFQQRGDKTNAYRLYKIITKSSEVIVKINYQPLQRPGPVPFDIEFLH